MRRGAVVVAATADVLLLRDDFSRPAVGWHPDGFHLVIRGGRARLLASPRSNLLVIAPAERAGLRSLRIRATAQLVSGGADTTFGVACFAGTVHYVLEVIGGAQPAFVTYDDVSLYAST